jgi:hypothetical protein
LISVDWQRLIRLEQGAQIAFVHQIGANEASKSERAGHGLLGCLRQAQQQKGDQRDSDLNANGVLRGAEKAADFEGLLDPAEEQFDGPPPPVQIGDDLGRSSQVIATSCVFAVNPRSSSSAPCTLTSRSNSSHGRCFSTV